MFKLIYSELIKLISKKKNILILAAMLILIGSYVKNMLPKDTDVVADTVSKYNAAVKEIQNKFDTEIRKGKVEFEELGISVDDKVDYPVTQEEIQTNYAIEKYEYILAQEQFYIKEGSALLNIIDGYKNNNKEEELDARIELEKLILSCKDNMLDNIDSLKCEVMQQRTLYEEALAKDQFLKDNNLLPINEDTSLVAFNFLRLVNRDLLLIIIIVVSLLIAADLVSTENEEGTFKFILIGKNSRTKILISKILAATIFSSLIIFFVLGVYFLYLGVTKGFGNINYPFEYCKYSFSFHSANIFAPEYDIMPGIQYFIINILYTVLSVLLTTLIGILISIFLQNSKASICLSLIIGLVMYKLSNPVGILKKLAFIFPSTYFSSFTTLKGIVMKTVENNRITFLNGLIVISLFIVIIFIVAIRKFKKQDVKC